MHQKLAYETIFSYTFCDWFNIWSNSHCDQSVGSSHGVNGSYLIFTCTCWQPSPLDYDHFDCALEHSMCAPVNLAMYRHCKEQMTFHLLAHTGVLHLLATHWLCIGIILIVVQSTVVLHQLTCQQLISGYWFALGFCTHWLCIGIILILVQSSAWAN